MRVMYRSQAGTELVFILEPKHELYKNRNYYNRYHITQDHVIHYIYI